MNRRMTIKTEAAEAGTRLDVLLAARVDGLSRSAAQALLAQGLVTWLGTETAAQRRPAKKNQRAGAGDVFELELPEPQPSALLPEAIPLDIVYEDAALLVINKPKGLVVHPAPGHAGGTLVNALLAHCGDALSGVGGEKRPGIVHRLDKDTSGLIVCAKTDAAHRALSAQLADRSLSREYEAIVRGHMPAPSGTVNAPIGRHPTDRKKMAVTQKNARAAVTHWAVIAPYRGYSHIRCKLETGRTHQIRVHMAHIGHPVAGDTVYGGRAGELGLDGQCLHARRIRFRHPTSGETLEFACPLPDYFLRALARLQPEG